MRTRKFTLKLGAAALTSTALALAANPTLAAEYWLKAAAAPMTMPGGASVVMWGYASCTDGTFATCGPVTVPGPALIVPPGDATLSVHLLNSLPVPPGGVAPPTSLVINGLIKPMTPVWSDGSTGARGGDLSKRVRSFDVEAQPNGTADYIWTVAPGTYLYQSGTQPQVQVQMGLYGAVTKNAVDAVSGTSPVRAQAYPGAAYEYDNQATLLYSEVDPALHAAIANGDYGPGKGTPSTINYAPKYFLINGQGYPSGSLVIAPAGNAGTTLLRMLNAGLTTHVPMIQGTHWTVVAEDGKPYPYRHTQYTALLPAAKTVDVLMTPDIGGARYAIMDRRLSLSNNGTSDGGMLAFLTYGAMGVAGGGAPANSPPVAAPDTYDSIVGVTLSVGAPTGVLANDSDPDNLPLPIKAVAATGSTTNGGTYTLNTNGSFSYTPAPGFAGADSFTYQITDGMALAAVPGTVTINLTAPTAPSLTSIDPFTGDATSLGGDWSQQVGTVTSVPDIGITSGAAVANTTTLGGLAVWNATSFGSKQGAGFTSGGPLGAKAYLVLKATGGTAIAPANYVRVGCENGQVVVSTMMGGSNTAAYVKQASFGACGSGPLSAVVDAKGLVTAFVNGAFAGGVQLPDVAAWKGGGRIGIQLTTVGATADNFAGATIP